MRRTMWTACGPVVALAIAAGSCGTPEDQPCEPRCGPGFSCYYGRCMPEVDAGAGDVTPDVPRDDGGGGDDGGVTPGKVDLLFVIDDSGSMAEEQVMLTRAFPALVEALFSPPTDPTTGAPLYRAATDVNVGVISTDMGTGTFPVPTCGASDDGVLLHAPSPSVPGCDPTYPTFLSGTTASHGADLAQDFSCIATLGTNGCGFEQPLAAMGRALTVHAGATGPNAGFVRPDAVLVVVILSDENDCSTDDPSIFDPAAPGNLNLRCYTHADRLDAVERYGDVLRGVKPGGRFAVGMMVGVPPDLGICNTTGDFIAPCLSDPRMVEQVDVTTATVRPVCENLPETRASPGVRFVHLARNLSNRAVVQSICDPQFPSFFQKLAQMAQAGR